MKKDRWEGNHLGIKSLHGKGKIESSEILKN